MYTPRYHRIFEGDIYILLELLIVVLRLWDEIWSKGTGTLDQIILEMQSNQDCLYVSR